MSCNYNSQKIFKPISGTVIGNTNFPVSNTQRQLESKPCSQNLTSTDCGNTVNEHALNYRYLISSYASMPDFTAIPTDSKIGAHWKNGYFTGMGYSTDVFCKPHYFGGKSTGNFHDELTGFTKNIMHVKTKLAVTRKLIDCETDTYTYKGLFLAFKEGEDDTNSDDECDGSKAPVFKYVGLEKEIKKYTANHNDISKFVVISTFLDERGIPTDLSDQAVLVNKGYSNSKPESINVLPNSNLHAFVMSNPQKMYKLIYEAKVNTNIYTRETSSSSCGCDNEMLTTKVSVKGDDVEDNILNFKLMSSQDSLTCGDVPDCAAPQFLQLTYCATPLKQSDCKCEDSVERAKLSAYLKKDSNLTENFKDGFKDGIIKSLYKYGGVNKTSIKHNDERNADGFLTTLWQSRYKYNPAYNAETTDNFILLYMEIAA